MTGKNGSKDGAAGQAEGEAKPGQRGKHRIRRPVPDRDGSED